MGRSRSQTDTDLMLAAQARVRARQAAAAAAGSGGFVRRAARPSSRLSDAPDAAASPGPPPHLCAAAWFALADTRDDVRDMCGRATQCVWSDEAGAAVLLLLRRVGQWVLRRSAADAGGHVLDPRALLPQLLPAGGELQRVADRAQEATLEYLYDQEKLQWMDEDERRQADDEAAAAAGLAAGSASEAALDAAGLSWTTLIGTGGAENERLAVYQRVCLAGALEALALHVARRAAQQAQLSRLQAAGTVEGIDADPASSDCPAAKRPRLVSAAAAAGAPVDLAAVRSGVSTDPDVLELALRLGLRGELTMLSALTADADADDDADGHTWTRTHATMAGWMFEAPRDGDNADGGSVEGAGTASASPGSGLGPLRSAALRDVDLLLRRYAWFHRADAVESVLTRFLAGELPGGHPFWLHQCHIRPVGWYEHSWQPRFHEPEEEPDEAPDAFPYLAFDCFAFDLLDLAGREYPLLLEWRRDRLPAGPMYNSDGLLLDRRSLRVLGRIQSEGDRDTSELIFQSADAAPFFRRWALHDEAKLKAPLEQLKRHRELAPREPEQVPAEWTHEWQTAAAALDPLADRDAAVVPTRTVEERVGDAAASSSSSSSSSSAPSPVSRVTRSQHAKQKQSHGHAASSSVVPAAAPPPLAHSTRVFLQLQQLVAAASRLCEFDAGVMSNDQLSMFAAFHPRGLVRSFTLAAIQQAAAAAGQPLPLPLDLLNIVADYAPVDLPYVQMDTADRRKEEQPAAAVAAAAAASSSSKGKAKAKGKSSKGNQGRKQDDLSIFHDDAGREFDFFELGARSHW